ncbi:hypothetical protein AB0C96_08290 [Streptomyces sp. NPDC048506]|uniref:tetratricopeptide repeat protein n=1 Tax=Streptomyces sp. NPDC048506 TaxID=3155028 RepID=UPI003424CFC9
MRPDPGSTDVTLRATADLLGDFVQQAMAHPVGRIERWFTEIRGSYEAVLADDPHNATAAVGLTVLAGAKLLAYVHHGPGHRPRSPYLRGTGWPLGLEELPLPLAEDDSTGRELAGDAVRAARRALALDPSDNLVAFFLGHALCYLGDAASARVAWREALRVDPTDHVVAELLAVLRDRPTEPTESADVCRCPGGFLLFRHRTRVSHSGEQAEACWLFNDPADIRQVVDGWIEEHPWSEYFEEELLEEDAEDDWDPKSPSFDPLPDDDLRVEIHAPGEPIVVRHVYRGLRRTPEHTVHLDWAAVPLPDRLPTPLPTGHPVRFGGRWYPFGESFHDL